MKNAIQTFETLWADRPFRSSRISEKRKALYYFNEGVSYATAVFNEKAASPPIVEEEMPPEFNETVDKHFFELS